MFFLILGSFWGRQRAPRAINIDLSWFFLTNHRGLVALICITRWKLMFFGQKIKVERSPPRFVALGALWRPQNDPKMRKNTDFSWVFLRNHRVLVALICLTRWELMIFGQKSKVKRSPSRFIALGAFWQSLNDSKMTQNEKKHWFYLGFLNKP